MLMLKEWGMEYRSHGHELFGYYHLKPKPYTLKRGSLISPIVTMMVVASRWCWACCTSKYKFGSEVQDVVLSGLGFRVQGSGFRV